MLNNSSPDYKATRSVESEDQIHCLTTIKIKKDENQIHQKVNQTRIEPNFYEIGKDKKATKTE